MAETRRQRRASSPRSAQKAIPFDMWLEGKKEADRRKEEEMREFKARGRNPLFCLLLLISATACPAYCLYQGML